MKKEIKVIISVVLAVWFFVMGFELGSYKEKKAQSENEKECCFFDFVACDFG